jgi:hypothetical protein
VRMTYTNVYVDDQAKVHPRRSTKGGSTMDAGFVTGFRDRETRTLRGGCP